jgi:tRNA (guanine-N7-)-methyltransferase
MVDVYERLIEQWSIDEDGDQLDPRAVFGPDARTILEIGCGRGDLAVSYAVSHPDDALMAIDVHTRGIANILAGIESRHLENVRVIEGDAQVFVRRLPSCSIDEIWVFFPDPWPKVRHRNRRLLRHDLIATLTEPLKVGGVLRLATDIEDYARTATDAVASSGRFSDPTLGRPDWRIETVFERRGVREGRDALDLTWTRVEGP